MNFLAHLFLSAQNNAEQVGNFIGDHVKGRDYQFFPQPVASGILLHRYIDDFTDRHPVAKETVTLLRPVYRRFSGVVADMLYDHYLAKNFITYSTTPLLSFEQQCYKNLYAHYSYLPDRVKNFLPKMKAAQRLQSYARIQGIYDSLDIMSRYTPLPHHTPALQKLFPTIDQQIEFQFTTFFQHMQQNLDMLRRKASQKLESYPPKKRHN